MVKRIRNTGSWFWVHKLVCLSVMGIVVVTVAFGPALINGNDAKAVSSTSSTTTSTAVASGDINVDVDEKSLAEIFEGEVHSDELAFGKEAEALLEGAAQERGRAAHHGHTLKTAEQLTAWLNSSDDPNAVPVRERVVNAITAKCGAEDVTVHLEDSKGWLLMVVKPESQVLHTSYMLNGQITFAGSWREVGKNDAYWLPVCTQGDNKGKIVPDGMVRADCGNGHDRPKIRIKRPETPPAIPVEQPPEKCFDAKGNPINRDAQGFCGSPFEGPEQQPVQSEPLSDPTLNDPTPGYVPGNAEAVSQQQDQAAADDNNVVTAPETYTPSPKGEPAPSEAGTPGGTENPDGSTTAGGTEGVSNPDASPGLQNDPVGTGDPGAP